jgi:hypothetical protein
LDDAALPVVDSDLYDLPHPYADPAPGLSTCLSVGGWLAAGVGLGLVLFGTAAWAVLGLESLVLLAVLCASVAVVVGVGPLWGRV